MKKKHFNLAEGIEYDGQLIIGVRITDDSDAYVIQRDMIIVEVMTRIDLFSSFGVGFEHMSCGAIFVMEENKQ